MAVKTILETQIAEITARIDNLKDSGDPAYGLKKERRVFYVQRDAIASAERRIAEQAFADAFNAKEAKKVRREFWVTSGESWSQAGIMRHGSDTGIPFTTFRAAKRLADKDASCYVAEFAHGELVKVTK